MANSDWAREPKQTFWDWCCDLAKGPRVPLVDGSKHVWLNYLSVAERTAIFTATASDGTYWSLRVGSFNDLKDYLYSKALKDSIPND